MLLDSWITFLMDLENKLKCCPAQHVLTKKVNFHVFLLLIVG